MRRVLLLVLVGLCLAVGVTGCKAEMIVSDDFIIADTEYGKTLLQVSDAGSQKSSLVIPYGVEAIGRAAFLPSMLSVTEVTIPSSVKRINDMAFADCSNLRKVTIEGSSALEFVGEEAFGNCTSLKRITFPQGVQTFGSDVFYLCNIVVTLESATPSVDVANLSSAKMIIVPDEAIDEYKEKVPSVSSMLEKKSNFIGDYVANGTKLLLYIGTEQVLTIPDSITEIAPSAFANNNYLQEVNLGTTRIVGEGAFYRCRYLKTVNFGTALTTIDREAFYSCSRLTSVVLPETARTIGVRSFAYCSNLTELKLNQGLATIGTSAFQSCVALKETSIPVSVTSIDSDVFYTCIQLTVKVEGRTTKPSGWSDWWSGHATVVWGN